MKREFTTEQLKELRKVNRWLTDGLFSKIIKDFTCRSMSMPYSIDFDAYAFNYVKSELEVIKVVDAGALLFGVDNFPLIKVTESKYREFRRYCILHAEYDNDYLDELASLFEKAFINVYRVYVDEETKKIAFAFWLQGGKK